MSTIRANTITDTAGTGAPTFSNGIISNGNVGIGVSPPSGKLHVAGGRSYFSAASEQFTVALKYNATTTGVWLGSPGTDSFTVSTEAGTERMRIDASGNLLFNSGYGSVATAYGCRAWVNFNGTGTVAIRASGNVTSITDNGVGDYTVNFTTAMPDANYSAIGATTSTQRPVAVVSYAAGSVQIQTSNGASISTLTDFSLISIAIFR